MQSQGPRGPRRVRLVPRASPPPCHRATASAARQPGPCRWPGAGAGEGFRPVPPSQAGRPLRPPPALPNSDCPPHLACTPPLHPPTPPPLRCPPLPGPSRRRAGRQEGGGSKRPGENISLCGGSAGPGRRPGGCWGRRTRWGPRGHPGTAAQRPGPGPHLPDKTKREGPLPCLSPGACSSFPEKEVIPLPVGQTLCLPDFPAFVGKRP